MVVKLIVNSSGECTQCSIQSAVCMFRLIAVTRKTVFFKKKKKMNLYEII